MRGKHAEQKWHHCLLQALESHFPLRQRTAGSVPLDELKRLPPQHRKTAVETADKAFEKWSRSFGMRGMTVFSCLSYFKCVTLSFDSMFFVLFAVRLCCSRSLVRTRSSEAL